MKSHPLCVQSTTHRLSHHCPLSQKMMICRRKKGQPLKKHGYYSSRSSWTRNDLIAFRTFLSMVMRPVRPPQGREQFLKLHPVKLYRDSFPCSFIDPLEITRFVPGVKTRNAPSSLLTHSAYAASNVFKNASVALGRLNFGCCPLQN